MRAAFIAVLAAQITVAIALAALLGRTTPSPARARYGLWSPNNLSGNDGGSAPLRRAAVDE